MAYPNQQLALHNYTATVALLTDAMIFNNLGEEIKYLHLTIGYIQSFMDQCLVMVKGLV